MIGDDRLTRTQREAGGRGEIIPYGRNTNDGWTPADASADQETSLCRNMLHNLAELGLHTLGRQAYRIVQQLVEARP